MEQTNNLSSNKNSVFGLPQLGTQRGKKREERVKRKKIREGREQRGWRRRIKKWHDSINSCIVRISKQLKFVMEISP